MEFYSADIEMVMSGWNTLYQKINATETIAFMRLVGQIPPKLCREPHPGNGKRGLGHRLICEAMLGIANIEGIFVDRVPREMKVFVVSRTDVLFSFSVNCLTFNISKMSRKTQLPEITRLAVFRHSVLAQCKSDDSWIQI
jgi:hypothetical protein